MRFAKIATAFILTAGMAGCAPHEPVQVASDGPSLRVAHQALADGQSGTSLAIAQGVLAQEPNNVGAMVQSADAKMAMGDRMGAEASYKRAIALEPHNLRAQLGMGKMQLVSDPKLAEATFQNVVANNPQSAIALTDLGVSLDRQNRSVEAQAAYTKALAIDPDLFSAHVDLALSLALNGQAARAEQMLRDAAESNAATPRVRADLAVAEIVLGHNDEAVQTLRTDLTPEDTKASMEAWQAWSLLEPRSRRVRKAVLC